MYLVVGSGSIGRRHHENLTVLGVESRLLSWRGLDMAALERQMAKATGAVIATATQVRLELIELCARNDLPVYIEKPLAFRHEELSRIYEVAAPIAARSVLGYMMRYHPVFQRLYSEPVEAYGFHMEIGHDVRQWRQNWRFADSYAARREGGGVLLDLCHEIDMAHCLYPGLGITSVDCVGHADFPGVDFATRLQLAGGALVGTIAMDYLSPKSLRRMSVRGRDAVVDLDLLTGGETNWQNGEEVSRDWKFERNDMFLGLMRDFICLAEGRPPSDNPLLPRLDRVQGSAALIADAWEARCFHSELTGGFA